VVTAAELTDEEIELLRTSVTPYPIVTAWLGDPEVASDVDARILLDATADPTDAAHELRGLLDASGVFGS
jgi:hypothetical protein